MHNIVVTNVGYVLGIVMVVFSIPLLIWDIPRNPWYGVRIPKAYASDEDWKTINTYGAKVLIFWGFVSIIISVIFNTFFRNPQHIVYLHQIVSIIFLIVAIVQILLFARNV